MLFAGLTALPLEVCRRTSLQMLSASYQPIAEITAEIGNLTQLTYLAFYSCPIVWVPQSLKRLTNLGKLWVAKKISCGGLSDAASLVASLTDKCRLEEDARRTCRAFMWVRKKAEPPYSWMPKEISRMICEVVLATAKQEAMCAVREFLQASGPPVHTDLPGSRV